LFDKLTSIISRQDTGKMICYFYIFDPKLISKLPILFKSSRKRFATNSGSVGQRFESSWARHSFNSLKEIWNIFPKLFQNNSKTPQFPCQFQDNFFRSNPAHIGSILSQLISCLSRYFAVIEIVLWPKSFCISLPGHPSF